MRAEATEAAERTMARVDATEGDVDATARGMKPSAGKRERKSMSHPMKTTIPSNEERRPSKEAAAKKPQDPSDAEDPVGCRENGDNHFDKAAENPRRATQAETSQTMAQRRRNSGERAAKRQRSSSETAKRRRQEEDANPPEGAARERRRAKEAQQSDGGARRRRKREMTRAPGKARNDATEAREDETA